MNQQDRRSGPRSIVEGAVTKISVDSQFLQELCEQIATEIGAIVSIFAQRGEIVASSRPQRIGNFHEGGATIMAREADFFEVTTDEAAKSPSMLEGVTLPVDFDGERVFCVAVAAPLNVARQFGRIVQYWVVSHLKAAQIHAQYERDLELSEQRFRDVAESAGDWIWEMDADLRFTYTSPRFYEIFPVSPEEIIGKTRDEFAGIELDEPHWQQHYASLAEHLSFRDFAYSTQLADGNVRHLQISGKPTYNSDGQFAGYRGTGRDVTKQAEAEQALELIEQRLTDAIEAISEGFSLYDRQDRLIIFNNKYKTLLYPGIEIEFTLGMTFESLIRRAAESGYIKDSEDRLEEWLEERLARHRDPGEPHIHQRGDGRWIMVSERRTVDGGTVAVYSDITELKQREEQLAEKSHALEKLSNQLAKYLSPQVYDSIFTGKKEVKIDSHRRKLTIFFSDIVGFTETADRLESEDLTKLLNHYLTEMSQIALAHGATIDKYVGDAIVIFFGDPETRGVKEDALACVKMALAMRRRMRELGSVWRASGIEKPLQCRMGINSDFCTVGNFGSEDRMDYTIIGGGVNLASRLETAATPGEILISYETYALVKDEIQCEDRGHLDVKGMAYPVATFQVVDTHDNLGKEQQSIHENHPHLNLDLEPDAMSAKERSQAEAILHRALDRLSDSAEGPKSSHSAKKRRRRRKKA